MSLLLPRTLGPAAAALVLGTLLGVSSTAETVVYRESFDGPPGTVYPGWSSSRVTYGPKGGRLGGSTEADPVVGAESPRGGKRPARFLGEFGGPRVDPTARTRVRQAVTLTLKDLPPHQSVNLAFRLLILKSWDGNSPPYGPDRWGLRVVGGPTLLDTTFSNNPKVASEGTDQDYPKPKSPPHAGAASVDTLGYRFFGDSTYNLRFSFPHRASTLALEFISDIFEGKGAEDESWGLDDVRVAVEDDPKRTVGGAEGPPALKVIGPKLQTVDGQPARLRGANLPSLEWVNTGEHILESTRVLLDEWKVNVIRLPLAQDRWFGKAPGQTDGGAAYRKVVDEVVRIAAKGRAYVVLDLHWSDAGEWGQRIAQHKMPDEHSLEFWSDAARRYANQPAVIYDLYNEPHDVTWEVWKAGGTVEETDPKTKAALKYATPGLQKLVNAVRATGAKNLIVVGGLDWSYDLSGLARGFALTDPGGNGLIYATHIYPWKKDWDRHVTPLADRFPIFVAEFGCEPDKSGKNEDPATWLPKLLAYVDRHEFSWAAWCFHPQATPRMIGGWNYAPTPFFGKAVKAALAGEPPGAEGR